MFFPVIHKCTQTYDQWVYLLRFWAGDNNNNNNSSSSSNTSSKGHSNSKEKQQ